MDFNHEYPSRGDAPDTGRRGRVQSLAEAAPVFAGLAAEMTALGYPNRDVFAVRLALDEAIANAIKHGHRGDAGKRVEVGYRVTAEQVVAEVGDEGPGFDLHRVPDPRGGASRERPGGRGLFLMRAYMTWVQFNARGNHVTLCKVRSG
jgi:serine/threonine-protein kinase RsbW